MRGGPPAFKDAHNVYQFYETETAAPCNVAMVNGGGWHWVIHELYYGYETDPIAASPHIRLRCWGGSVHCWSLPVVSKGPNVWSFPGGIWLPPSVSGFIELVSGGAGIVGHLGVQMV